MLRCCSLVLLVLAGCGPDREAGKYRDKDKPRSAVTAPGAGPLAHLPAPASASAARW